jgi:hypothetical protein
MSTSSEPELDDTQVRFQEAHGARLFRQGKPRAGEDRQRAVLIGGATASSLSSGRRRNGHMEDIAFTHHENAFHIEGFPDAIKVLKTRGPKSRRLADLSLHKNDLDFALECLETINSTPSEPWILREVLWQAAIVSFVKCFGQSKSRFSLNHKDIYKADVGAVKAYKFFLSLRNKHIVHDENSYTQSIPGAVLNKDGMGHKIAKIIFFSATGITLGQEQYSNLKLLATDARKWVISQFDEGCDILTAELEARPYNELLAMEGMTYTVPPADDVHKPRASL